MNIIYNIWNKHAPCRPSWTLYVNLRFVEKMYSFPDSLRKPSCDQDRKTASGTEAAGVKHRLNTYNSSFWNKHHYSQKTVRTFGLCNGHI